MSAHTANAPTTTDTNHSPARGIRPGFFPQALSRAPFFMPPRFLFSVCLLRSKTGYRLRCKAADGATVRRCDNMKVATKLYLLVSLLICLATATSLTGLNGMRTAVAGLDTVYKDRVVPMGQIKDIADAYAVQIVDTSHKVRNGSMTPQSGLQHVEAAEKIIAERWAAYLATVLVDDEKNLVVKIEPAMQSADNAVSTLKKLLAANNIDGLTVFVSQDMYPAIDPVSDLLSQLIQVQMDVSKQV